MPRRIRGRVVVTELSLGINRKSLGNILKLAKGGIVTNPTFALVGEAGPEAVILFTPGVGTGNVEEKEN